MVFENVTFGYHAGQTGADGRVVRGEAGTGHRHFRHDRRGQEHVAGLDSAVLRSAARAGFWRTDRICGTWTWTRYRRQIGIVYQESFLFSNTVAANIAFGHPHATMEQIERAARIASAHEFITALPHGYETVLGESGVDLSGGQRQRLALARALLLQPPILILDDPTASVDARTENEIVSALREAMAGRTTFVVSSRLSLLRRADLILVLEDGRLTQIGHARGTGAPAGAVSRNGAAADHGSGRSRRRTAGIDMQHRASTPDIEMSAPATQVADRRARTPSAREAITYYNPMEEREADKAPLQLALIRRIFRYTKPYAAKRNWLFVLTFTRGLQLPALAWLIGRTINGPIAGRDLPGIYWYAAGYFALGAVHGGDVSFPPAVRARTGRGGGARHAVGVVRAS